MNTKRLRIVLSAFIILGLNSCIAEANVEPFKKSLSVIRIQQCREGCLEKFAIKEALCQQRPECSLSGFPPYNYNSLPDALHLLCWDECAKPPPPKINKTILETWALRTVSMNRKGSLVLVDVAWSPFNTPNQCLVTWEVSGGGLMGNLLTESTNVQLSLWPDTKYRVQVTCKNKLSGAMSRSLPLTIDTTEAITEPNQTSQIHISSSNQTKTLSKLITNLSSNNLTSSSSSSSSPSLSPSSGFVVSSSPIIESDIEILKLSSSESSTSSNKKNQIVNNERLNFVISNADIADLSAVNGVVGVSVGSSNGDSSISSVFNPIETHLNNDFEHFDWHDDTFDNNNNDNSNNNGDVTIDKISVNNSDDIKILTIAALSHTQTPLIYGILAGTIFLAVIILLHICILRSKRISGDKKALIDDDGNATATTTTNNHFVIPSSLLFANGCNNNINRTHADGSRRSIGVGGRCGSVGVNLNNNNNNDNRNNIDQHCRQEDVTNDYNSSDLPIDSTICSRNFHVLTV